jgi:hypothetical protein
MIRKITRLANPIPNIGRRTEIRIALHIRTTVKKRDRRSHKSFNLGRRRRWLSAEMRIRELGQPQRLAERRVHVREEGLELVNVRAVPVHDDEVD